MSPRQKHFLWEAVFALAFARIAMASCPFRRIARWLGTPGAETPVTVTLDEARMAEEVGWAVRAVGRRVPWDARCLAQALAATGMLRRRGIEGTVSFGACEDDLSSFSAHAWLRVGSCMVTGGEEHERFNIFTTFARR